MGIRLLAFDLDGTFLDDEKNIPPENLLALRRADSLGVRLVPATGRIYDGIPPAIRDLPFIRYYLTVNGAYVYDAAEDEVLKRGEIPAELALSILAFADSQHLIYDCYQDNWGWMTATMLEQVDRHVDDPGILKLIKSLRHPVDSLPEYIRSSGKPLQKLQFYTTDPGKKERIIKELGALFPQICITSSVRCNIEINSREASKGQALTFLCRHLNIPLSQTLAVGDGSNDIDMLETAAFGVAMGNAPQIVKDAADFVTIGNNESGFAKAVMKYIEG